MKSLIIISSLLIAQLSHAITTNIDNLEWQPAKQIGSVKVLSARVPNSPYDAYMAVTVMNASTAELVAIIRDPSTCSKWAYRCGESYRYARESDNIDLVYTSSKMPFPLKNRDTLARIIWQTDPETKVVRAIGKATKDILEPMDNHVRIDEATVVWELTPLPDGNTQVRTFGHADPGGEIPSWLTNQFTTDVPVKSLSGLRKILKAD